MEIRNEASQGDYTISTDKSKLDPTVIHAYLAGESYWAKNIPMEVVQRSIDHSLCFGLYHKDAQVGFARVVTDRATFAYLADVFVLPGHRGKGLSKWMIAFIHEYPELQGLRRWLLGTLDAHELYKQFGWQALSPEVVPRFMQRHFPDVYK
ncbi:GNAT family N-acetyltransferase [Sediminibacterium roseum]|uniref:GNAT family N-acetyltransferase n=1 Tax=Sediminibacterium roseum TaxID=1978412 RepID=A0ABX0A3W3_9BACT|nr:GNAT family N-acetyltransferase [Sediminibacterium roseum]NCI51905.1 GNAT family N-acetyltransferase [Sediminibacterium roseum]